MTEESVRKYINGILWCNGKWAVADGKLLKSINAKLFHPIDKDGEIRITTDIFEPHEIKAIFRYRGLRLELLNAMRKGDSISIARLTYWAPLLEKA